MTLSKGETTTEARATRLKLSELSGDELSRWQTWLDGLERPARPISPSFEVDFNLEYWSCRLFGGDSKEPKKTHAILGAGDKVLGRIEVGAYAGMNLEPFDRLAMLALIQLWYDQGADPQGRIAFSYRELFRRLGLKAGGRQTTQIKDALDRLRRCFITLTNCFVTRDAEGRVVPVEAEADPFTILRLKQTATVGSGDDAQRLVVCQLSSVVLAGLFAPDRLRPRVHSSVLRKLRAKNSTSILLHGFYNGRLRVGEERFFDYVALGEELGIREQYHSNLVNRLLSPHEKLESIGAISIEEPRGKGRRGRGLTIGLLAPPDDSGPVRIEISATKRVPLDKKDKDQLPLFEETPVEYDEQLLLAFRAAGVKNIRQLLKRYGKNIAEKALWSLLESVRDKNADETWQWRRGPDAYVAKCLNDGFYVPEDYTTPKERLQEAAAAEARLREQEEAREMLERARADRFETILASLRAADRVRLEDAAVEALLADNKGLQRLVGPSGAPPMASVEERWNGLRNSVVREGWEERFRELVLEHGQA